MTISYDKNKMDLEEAIQHAREKANDESICIECRNEHAQLADWLRELQFRREK